MANPDIQRYLDGIESQHKTQQRYIDHLTEILEKIDAAHGIAKDIPLYFYVKQAVGDQLDAIAKYVGADRRFPPITIPGYDPLLTDEMFRIVVLARIIQNQWDGTHQSFREIWDATLGQWMNATYHDNQDMTMDVNISGTVEPIMTELILAGYIIPKPMAVGLNVDIIQIFITDQPALAADLYFDSAQIRLHHPYQTDPAQIALKAGSKPLSRAAHLIIPIFQCEQQAADTIASGTAMPSNYARIAVTII